MRIWERDLEGGEEDESIVMKAVVMVIAVVRVLKVKGTEAWEGRSWRFVYGD